MTYLQSAQWLNSHPLTLAKWKKKTLNPNPPPIYPPGKCSSNPISYVSPLARVPGFRAYWACARVLGFRVYWACARVLGFRVYSSLSFSLRQFAIVYLVFPGSSQSASSSFSASDIFGKDGVHFSVSVHFFFSSC